LETNNIDIAHITEMLETLSEDGLSTIDFDNHRQWLSTLAVRLPELLQIDNELSILRTDYEKRIAGMTKAIAAVDRNRDALKQAVTYLETLPKMSAADLVRNYTLMSARFRDAFPTSFGSPPVSTRRTRGTRAHNT